MGPGSAACTSQEQRTPTRFIFYASSNDHLQGSFRTGSPLLYFAGPEASPGQDEVTLQVPDASRATRPSSSAPCTDPAAQDPSEVGESPVVQSDEEGVEVDTALATLHTDDSDS